MPILVVWFGIGTIPAILTAFLISFFPIVVNVATGLATLEPELEDVLRSLGATKSDILWKVGLPRSLPYFFASLKVAITLAFVGTVVSETVASNEGIGYLMMSAGSSMRMPLVFAGLIVIGVDGDGDVRALRGARAADDRLGAPRRDRRRLGDALYRRAYNHGVLAAPMPTITALRTIRIAERPNLLWLELETDDGLTGLGESFRGAQAVEAVLHEQVAPYLLGRDAQHIEAVSRAPHRRPTSASIARSAEMRAASAVDIALWDLAGQRSRRARLSSRWAAASRDSIRAYNTCAGYSYNSGGVAGRSGRLPTTRCRSLRRPDRVHARCGRAGRRAC